MDSFVRFILAPPGRYHLPLCCGQKSRTRICTGKLPLKVTDSRPEKPCRLALLTISSMETPKLFWRKLNRLQKLQVHLRERAYGELLRRARFLVMDLCLSSHSDLQSDLHRMALEYITGDARTITAPVDATAKSRL